MSVSNFIAELFGLPTREMYDDILNEHLDLQFKYNDLKYNYSELKQKYDQLKEKRSSSKTPYIKVEENIFKYFKKFIVRTVHKKKRYSKSFDTIEEARSYLKEVKNG